MSRVDGMETMVDAHELRLSLYKEILLHTSSPRQEHKTSTPGVEREREREMAHPPAKRLRMTVSVGDGGEAAAEMPPSPGSRKLRQILLVVLFLVRVSVRNTVTASLSQIGRMVQKHVDRVFHEYHGNVSSKLESFQGQIEGLRHEVKQLARLYSNRQADQYTRQEPNHEHGAASGSNTSFRLCFLNDMKIPIYTEKNITAENNAAIKIGIFEGDTMITTGPLSKIKAEILVLRGDFSNDGRESWTEEEFNNHIVQGRDGQGFVLGGDCSVWLINGEASLGRLRFKEGSCRTRSRKFVVGARVCKSEKTGVRIQEAVMKPVTVLDRRNEANEKRHPPELNDEVYRLEEISKDGTYHKRLQKADIFIVQDFLKALNMDANKLREETLQMKRNISSWEKMVRHAQECSLEGKHELKQYQNEEGNVVLFFNCVYQLVGAAFHGDYITYDELEPAQRAVAHKLKAGACNNLESIPFDYVMKGKFPEPILSSTNSAAGPSILVRGASQPKFSADHLAAHQNFLDIGFLLLLDSSLRTIVLYWNLSFQGTTAAEIAPCDEINHATGPLNPNANYDPSNSVFDDLNTHDYRDQGTRTFSEQQIWTYGTPDWQQDQGPINSPSIDVSENWAFLESILQDGPSEASTSAQHQVSQLQGSMPLATSAWTAAAPSDAEHRQEPSSSAFPGSGHSNF